MHSEIIVVGSELLSFGRTDTNSLYIASRLADLGISVRYKQVVGDRLGDISLAIKLALGRSEIIFLTGGLGPTSDDITREAVAEALSRDLKEDAGVVREMELLYKKWGRSMSENNRRQSMVPDGAAVLPNFNGTAPGLFLHEGDRLIFVLPGPPRELNPMMDEQVVPHIRKHKGVSARPARIMKVASVSESALDNRIEAIYKEYPDVETTILSSPGIISLYFTWREECSDQAQAEACLDELTGRIREELGDSFLSDSEENLQEAVGLILKEKAMTLALAESCTGGLIGKMLTDVPGSSAYYLGGIVSYSNAVKERILEVPSKDLLDHGAVSAPVAEKMALGARKCLEADIGLAVTGIAGPGGGTEEKPVGTVFIGLSAAGTCRSWRIHAIGSREIVRLRSANQALDRLRIWLLTGK
jgi:nicotinamide-nucleotide amidase